MSSARRAGVGAATVVGLAALLVSGCSASTSSHSAPLPPITSVAPPAQPLPEPSEQVQQDGLAAICSASTQQAVEDVVGQQLAAFRARDFDAAFALASEQFRAITDADGLRRLISKGHPEVLNSVSHEFTECRQAAPDLILAAVNVTGMNGKTVLLVYQFTLEDEQWRILQSAPMNGHGQQGAPSEGGVQASSV